MTSLPEPYHALTLVGGRLCLDFCNTVEYHDTDHRIELLQRGYASLVGWSTKLGIISKEQSAHYTQVNEAQSEQTHAVFERAETFREALYQIFVAVVAKTPPPPESLQVLNKVVQDANDHRVLVPRDQVGLIWRWQDQDSLEAMLWPIALSAADVLVADDLERIRQCPGCGWLFFDQSRNRSRTWCDMRFCGNRSKARNFYQRQKSSA